MPSNLVITIPTANQINFKSYPLTDFAVATGGACSNLHKEIGSIRSRIGKVLLSECSSNQRIKVLHYNGKIFEEVMAGERSCCVLPLLRKSKLEGFDISIINGEQILTFNGQVVLYPQTYANKKLCSKLNMAVNNFSISPIESFSSDAVPVTSNFADVKYVRQVNKCYEFEGNMYVLIENSKAYDQDSVFRDGTKCEYGKQYWFVCEPIKVKRLENGDIQFNELLTSCQFDPQTEFEKKKLNSPKLLDTDKFAVGRFLNGDFLADLKKSFGLYRKQIIPNYFDNIPLKNNTKVIGQSSVDSVGNIETYLTDYIVTQSNNILTSALNYKPENLKEKIESSIKNGKSVCLNGPDAAGKSKIVKQLDSKATIVYLRNDMAPEELVGTIIYPTKKQALPLEVVEQVRNEIKDTKSIGKTLSQDFERTVKDKIVKVTDPENNMKGVWIPPYWYNKLCGDCKKELNKNHVIFIDNIAGVNFTTQSLVKNLVKNRSISSSLGALPKNAVVVGSNTVAKTKSDNVQLNKNSNISLQNSFDEVINIDKNVINILEWGSQKKDNLSEQNKIHPAILTFFASGDFNHNLYSSLTGNNSLDFRLLEQLSDIVYDNNDLLRQQLLESKIGLENTKSLFLSAMQRKLGLDDIILKNYGPNNLPKTELERIDLIMRLRNADISDRHYAEEFIANEFGDEYLSVYDKYKIEHEQIHVDNYENGEMYDDTKGRGLHDRY